MPDGPAGTTPVSEFHIHSEIYKARPEINSVLHAHPKVPTLFTIAKGAELKIVLNHGYRWRSGVPVHPDTAHIDTPSLGAAMVDSMGDSAMQCCYGRMASFWPRKRSKVC